MASHVRCLAPREMTVTFQSLGEEMVAIRPRRRIGTDPYNFRHSRAHKRTDAAVKLRECGDGCEVCSIYTAASQVRCLLSRKENEEEEKRRKSERGGTFLTFFPPPTRGGLFHSRCTISLSLFSPLERRIKEKEGKNNFLSFLPFSLSPFLSVGKEVQVWISLLCTTETY